MANVQRKIKPAMKRLLMKQAGDKCANPGCTNWRVHIHHIQHWAVCKTHDDNHMIAICPSCHDEVHHGRLAIDDETLYRWKGQGPLGLIDDAHLVVPAATHPKLQLGELCFMSRKPSFSVFQLADGVELTLRIIDGDLVKVSARLRNAAGIEVLRIAENTVRVRRDGRINFDFRAGRARVTVPNTEEYLPRWVLDKMQEALADFGRGDSLVALDVEVIEPGLVKLQGLFLGNDAAVVATTDALVLVRRSHFVQLRGVGAVFVYDGPLDGALFGFPVGALPM